MKRTNNNVILSGVIQGPFVFSHQSIGVKYYQSVILVKRASGAIDCIPFLVTEHYAGKNLTGCHATIEGVFRSHNLRISEEHSKLLLHVYAKKLVVQVEKNDINNIWLVGVICKTPIYRKTPLGREITDLLLAVNRPNGRSDYIPCVCWGSNAIQAVSYNVGDCLSAVGRIQSRVYKKVLANRQVESRIAYEVSLCKVMSKEE